MTASGWSRCGEWRQSGSFSKLRAGDLARDSVQMFHGAVLVVDALDGQHRGRDLGEEIFDVPRTGNRDGARSRSSPGRRNRDRHDSGRACFLRSPEFVIALDLADACEGNLFDETDAARARWRRAPGAWRHGLARWTRRRCGRTESGDRFRVCGADRAARIAPRDDEVRRSRPRGGFGTAVAVARVDQRSAVRGFGQAAWEILPHGDGAQAFVEEDYGRMAGDVSYSSW